jgi:hypothetical protein
MNGKIGIRVISVVLAVMLVSVVLPTVSAQVAAEVSGDTSLETINDLRDKDISMGEFYEKIAPVEFSALPAEIQNECYNTKMVWLELPKIGDKVQVIQHNASTLETKFTDVRMRSIVILMRHVSDIGADGRSIDYRSESWVVFPPYLPLPYGEVSSGLYKLDPDGQTGTLVDYVFESGEKIDNLKAEGSKTVTESGYYFTEGLHLFYTPAGYTLSPSLSRTQTDAIYVS